MVAAAKVKIARSNRGDLDGAIFGCHCLGEENGFDHNWLR